MRLALRRSAVAETVTEVHQKNKPGQGLGASLARA